MSFEIAPGRDALQANQVREKETERATRNVSKTGSGRVLDWIRCPHSSAPVHGQTSVCPSCGKPLTSGSSTLISLKDALLFASILLLISMAISPVWPKDQIYGKSIQFLARLGQALPTTPDEAAAFRHQMMNVVQAYQGINLLHYVLISAFIFLFGIHLFRLRKQAPGFSDRVWVLLGLLLLVFPVLNLVISWSMFLSPGVLGTAVTSLFIVIAASFLE